MFLIRHRAFVRTGFFSRFFGVTKPVTPCRHVHLEVTPTVSRMDDSMTIQVDHLSPKQPVTLAAMVEEEGDVLVSHAHYCADENGRINSSVLMSTGGTFTGVEIMGLFRSIQPQLGSRSGIRLRKKDVTQPHSFTLSVIPGHVDANHSSHHNKPGILAQTDVKRCYMWEDVLRVPVRHGRVRGTLFIPQSGQGKHPGLIDIYGSTGGLPEYRAAMLASRGFTTLALAFVGYQDLPQSLIGDFDYFLEAVDFLADHDNVGSSKLGIIGTSMGAAIALNLAPLDTRIRAIVAVGAIGHRITPHVYKGEQLSFKAVNWDHLKEMEAGVSFQDMMYNAQSPDCLIPVEEAHHTDILFLHGTSDMFTDPRLMLNVASRLLDHGHTGVNVHMYQGAGHIIEPPYIPFCYASWHKLCGANAIWGGERLLHTHAQVDAWAKTLGFFKDRILLDRR